MRSNLPNLKNYLGQTVPNRQDIKIMKHVASGNDGHLSQAYSTTLQRNVACKIIPKSNLAHGGNGEPLWQAEVHKADRLRNSSVVKFESVLEWTTNECDCIALISEFVEGPSLREFSQQSPSEIDMPFIVDFLSTMLNLFHEMSQRQICHGDLHAGNVLVEDRSYDLLGPRFAFRVTDFGVGDASSEQRFKDDYLQLADIVQGLLRSVDYTKISPRDKYTFKAVRDEFVARSLVERDPTRDPIARQPNQLLTKLQQLGQAFEKSMLTGPESLSTPFDFLSCEQIGDSPTILEALYSEQFLGIREIEGRNNIVVTGPRGCGKSTVFKALSLDHRIQVSKSNPGDISYIGIYYRCDDLYFAFPRYRASSREEAIDLPVHFITATLLARCIQSIQDWALRHFPHELKESEANLCDQIWRILGLHAPNSPSGLSFASVISRLHKERLKAAERHRFVNDEKRPIGFSFGPETIHAVCRVLKTLSFIRDRPIYFFVDDYSSPKVTEALQANLNRVFMQRSSDCFFKVSTESSVSFQPVDVDGKRYVENREYTLYNLGLVYLHANTDLKQGFIEDVFRRRLAATPNFPVKELNELVGVADFRSNNELARQIRSGEQIQTWGTRSLVELCSGDVHYVISLVGEMVRLSGGISVVQTMSGAPKIKPDVQNRAIRDAAGAFLKNLRGIPKVGEKLVDIVQAFGNIAHSQMRFIDSKNENESPPKQATRIEPYEPLKLDSEGRTIYNELLRYSVFLEDFRGKSRRGHVVPRLYLRRFLIPHFNLTFSKRDSIELETEEFELFLLSPSVLQEKKEVQKPTVEGPSQPFLKFGEEDQK